MSPIGSAALKVGVSLAASAIVLYRTRGMPREALGLARPALAPAILIGAVYLAWMFGTNAAIGWRGPWDFAPWLAAPLLASIFRVLAVGILGPIAEELIFRGWFFALVRGKARPAAAVALTAVGWTALHYDYSWPVLGVILVDGILLGLARWKSGSVYPAMAMHSLYNLYAVW